MEHTKVAYSEWMALAAEEYARIIALVATFREADWSQPTDCELWSVRDIVAHLAGAAEATASMREMVRQQRAGKASQGDGDRMAAVNALQVRERESLSTDALVDQLRDASARGVRARSRIPALVRAPRLPMPPPLGSASLGYLNGPIFTRDAWMHRMDLCRATRRAPVLTATHDGRIVADVVADWRDDIRPGLELTGPAGGRFGPDSPSHRYDAIEFCRALAGRESTADVAPDVRLF